MTRRSLLGRIASMVACSAIPSPCAAPYDSILQAHFRSGSLVGLEACVIEDGRPSWCSGYGLADVRRQIPMTADTIINIASVSKTVTACAVTQLCERGLLKLDEDINRYVRFPVRNPVHASSVITVRHLLAHTSSLADGPAYASSYLCGNSTISLGDWVAAYVLPGGRHFSRENFCPWPPGERFQYSNVGFGVLGCAVERASGQPFSTYCRREIFEPLGMRLSSFDAANLPPQQQAVPYTTAEGAQRRERVVRDERSAAFQWNGTSYLANCLYSFPNFPDGLVRTTAREFSCFVSALLCRGEFKGTRILGPASIDEMFREQFPRAARPTSWPAVQGLAWYALRTDDSKLIWLHTGADPGVGTVVMCYPPARSGVLLFANTSPAEGLTQLAGDCLRQAARRSAPLR